jgi:hypothetical protein
MQCVPVRQRIFQWSAPIAWIAVNDWLASASAPIVVTNFLYAFIVDAGRSAVGEGPCLDYDHGASNSARFLHRAALGRDGSKGFIT